VRKSPKLAGVPRRWLGSEGHSAPSRRSLAPGWAQPREIVDDVPRPGDRADRYIPTYSGPARATETPAGFTESWSVTRNRVPFASASGAGFSFTPDAAGTYVVTLVATDYDGDDTATDTTTISVFNPQPLVTAPADQSAPEGTSTSFALGSFTNSGVAGPWVVEVDWGDGSAHTSLSASSPGSLGSSSHTYAYGAPTVYAVTVTVTNPGQVSASAMFHVMVFDNTVPSADDQSASVNENSSGNAITLTGSDADSDALTFAVIAGPSHGTLAGSGANQTYTPFAGYQGPDSFTFTATDDGGNTSNAATVSVTAVDNTVPVANAQTISVNEDSSGNAITLTGSDADNDALTFAIVSGPSHGTLTGSGANRTYTPSAGYQGPDSFTFTATDDGGNTGSTATVSITVVDVRPTAAISGPTVGVPGQPRAYIFSATDPSSLDQAAGFAYTVNWGDGSSVLTIPATAGNGSGVRVEHVFTAPGTYKMQVTAQDQDGFSAASVTQTATVQSAMIQGDTLAVGGTLGNDTIVLTPADATGAIAVSVNGVGQGKFKPSAHILVYGQAGSDTIKLRSRKISGTTYTINVPAILYGGAGKDLLDVRGSSANNVLLGEGGSNTLYGGLGRDILIGGQGPSSLYAGSGDDILIAGITDYDSNSTALSSDQKLAALYAIMAEWARTDADYLTRVHHLDGSLSGGLNNGFYLNTATVHDNGVLDRLFGTTTSALDWFLAGSSDTIKNKKPGEVVMTIR
jgi:PKD repeat protein